MKKIKAAFLKIYQEIFPAARKAVQKSQYWLLGIFLLFYAMLCFGLDWFDVLVFEKPYLFALSVFLPWLWWMHQAGYSGLPRVRGNVSLLIRLCLAGAFIMMLAEPRTVRTRDELAVIYAIDLSDSIGNDSVDKAIEFVARTVVTKPDRDKAGLIAFGKNASVELPPRVSFPMSGEVAFNSRIIGEATNLQKALSLSAAMLPEDFQGRIVLVSDGTETEGDISEILKDLKARNIAVDVMPIEYQYDSEVWLDRLDLPQNVKLGENYEANVVLSSLKKGTGKLILRENGNAIYEENVEFKAGKNRFSIPIKLREAGYYEYTATIIVDGDQDHLDKNNSIMNYIYVAGEGKVLLVTNPDGDPRDYEKLVQAIREGERDVSVIDAFEFPQSALSLMPYDAIIFVNVPADMFDEAQLQAAHNAVREMGVGFVMIGGKDSFGPGGFRKSPIEKLLPVSMDVTNRKKIPKAALVIILHTCEFPQGNTWAKRITKKAIQVLNSRDEAGVLAYLHGIGGTKDDWIFELMPVSEYDTMVPLINNANIGDMPGFGNTMTMAFNGLRKSNASVKHVIIISDGDPPAPPPALLVNYKKHNISVTTVAVFPHGGTDPPTMRLMAKATGGRYYKPTDPNELPSIFIKEAKTVNRKMIVNKTVTPEVNFPSAILKGINSIPPVNAYVLTTPKPRAEVILQAKSGEEGEVDPILVTGRYGLGMAAALTSDLSPNWGKHWVNWGQYRAFVKQLMIHVSRVQQKSHLRMWTDTSGSKSMIVVEDYHPESSFLEVTAMVAGPDSKTQTLQLKQVSPRRYQAIIPHWGRGQYHVVASGVSGDRSDKAMGGFVVSYSPEYTRFRSNPIALKKIAKETNGESLVEETAAEKIYKTRREVKRSSSPVFDWFLFTLACLIPLDVAIRRIQIDWYSIKSMLGFGLTRESATKTMNTLLDRKKKVSSRWDGTKAKNRKEISEGLRRNEHSSASSRGESSQTYRGKQSKKSDDSKKKPGDGSTTSRLLDMKRKRDDKPE